MNPLQQIIHDNLEHRNHFPVPARDVYMVMGKMVKQWKTIITKTDDINHARRTMYAAQMHGTFSRLVLCKAREIQGINSLRWKTMECALPLKTHIMPPSEDMKQTLARLKSNPANKNSFGSFGRREDMPRSQKQAVPVVKEREIANFPLSMAVIGAILSMQFIPFLAAVAMIFTDWLYVEEKLDGVITPNVLSFFIRYRAMIYLLIGFAVLIPALVVTFAQSPSF